MDTGLIYAYCDVVKEVETPVHAIFYWEDGFGYADVETVSEGVVHYSCWSEAEFNELVALCEGD